MKSIKCFSLIILIALFFSCSNKDSNTIITIEEGKVGVIGYGSLMSKNSMEKTLKRKYHDSIYIVHLEDYQRDWNHFRSMDYVPKELIYIHNGDSIPFKNELALNIMDSKDKKLNCVLYFISHEELKEFDEREFGYERIDVTNKIEEYQFKGGNVYAYKADNNHTYKHKDDDNTFLPDFYVNLVYEACDSLGVEFKREFESSTNPLDKAKVISPSNVYAKNKE